jgi:hypothetical protein
MTLWKHRTPSTSTLGEGNIHMLNTFGLVKNTEQAIAKSILFKVRSWRFWETGKHYTACTILATKNTDRGRRRFVLAARLDLSVSCATSDWPDLTSSTRPYPSTLLHLRIRRLRP